MKERTDLVLASGSAGRRAVLQAAGIPHRAEPAQIDERAVETAAGPDLLPADIALLLSEAKAMEVSDRLNQPGIIVLGCDQVLEDHEGRILYKAATMDDARRRLLHLRGETHTLHSAQVLVKDGETLWRNVETAHLTMRDLTPEFIGHHLARVGDGILGSVGCYQIEGEGIQLFQSVTGDHFTIIGMPLLPLLTELRRLGVIET